MSWNKRNSSISDVKSAVLFNSGLSEKEFFCEKENYYIKNLDKAAEMIKNAVSNKEKIVIIGDYDVDGITSTSILYLMLNEMGCKNVQKYIPRRFTDGYGVPRHIIDKLDCDLLITVDNGISAVEQIKVAKEKGIKVLILDHHLPDAEKGLPPADIIVDPHATGGCDFNNYCGAGLAYKLALEIGNFSEDFIDKICALAAIGTVTDVMPLIYDNRRIVIKGLKALNNCRGTTGTNTLLKRLGLSIVQPSDIGFRIGPVLNAAGRMDDGGAFVSFSVLTYEANSLDRVLVENISKLEKFNSIRKFVTDEGIDKAHRKIAEDCLYGDKLLLLYTTKDEINSFHEGIVGIIAGRLSEEFKVPVFVLTESSKPGILKGSGRSYGGVHIKDLLDKVPTGILEGYGGHSGAAGISVSVDKVDELRNVLINLMNDIEIKEKNEDNFYDIEISQEDIPKMLEKIKKYAPYGEGNPSPVFKINKYRLYPRAGEFFSVIGENGSTIKLYGENASAIGFGMTEKFRNAGEPHLFTIYGTISENYYLYKAYTQVEMFDFEADYEKKSASTLADLVNQKMRTMFM